MLDRYLSIQEDRLQDLGRRKQKQQELLEREQQQLNQLIEIRDTIPYPDRQNPYFYQQRALIQSRLNELVEMQNEKLDVARSDALIQHQAMLSQYRKIKGFQLLRENQRIADNEKVKRMEQREADDWVSQAHHRR